MASKGWTWTCSGVEEAMQYHQLRILCALRDKIAENERGCRSGIASGGG